MLLRPFLQLILKSSFAFTYIFIFFFIQNAEALITDAYCTVENGTKCHMLGGKNPSKKYVGFILNYKEKAEDLMVLKNEFNEAFVIYNNLCNKNDIDACHNLGLMYIRGLGVEKNIKKGLPFLEKSMEKLSNFNTAFVFYNKAEKELERQNKSRGNDQQKSEPDKTNQTEKQEQKNATDRERQQLAEERRRLEKEKRQQQAENIKDDNPNKLPPCPTDQNQRFHNCFGTFTNASGDKYVGEFKDDNPNGQGTLTLTNGDKYVGEFKDGKFNGQGTYTFANGDKYVGESKDGNFHGQGTYTFANGNKYVGEYKDDKRNGQGTLTLTNGVKYVGEFKDGKYNGQGTYTFANGDKYVGEFKDSKSHGIGVESYVDGRPPREGIWADDKFVRAEKIVTPNELTKPQRKLDAGDKSESEGIPKPSSAEAKRKNKNSKFAGMKCVDFGFVAGTQAHMECVKEFLKSSGIPN